MANHTQHHPLQNPTTTTHTISSTHDIIRYYIRHNKFVWIKCRVTVKAFFSWTIMLLGCQSAFERTTEELAVIDGSKNENANTNRQRDRHASRLIIYSRPTTNSYTHTH